MADLKYQEQRLGTLKIRNITQLHFSDASTSEFISLAVHRGSPLSSLIATLRHSIKTGGQCHFWQFINHVISLPLLGGHFIADQGRVFAGHANSLHLFKDQT